MSDITPQQLAITGGHLLFWAGLFSSITTSASTASVVYFLEDFNLSVDWVTVTSTADYETSVLHMLDEHKLFQVVDVLTTVTNTFDICFTNELASVINHQINQGLSENYALAGKPCSDHRAVTVDLEIQTTTTVDIPQKSKFFNFCRADYDKINQLTSTKSFSAVGWSISDVLVSEWYAWLEEIFEETITVRTIHRANLPPWVSPGTSYLLKRLKSKRKLNRNSSKVGSSKKEVDDRVALEQAEYEQELSLGTSTNLLCKHFNSFRKSNPLPATITSLEKEASDDFEKANLFNEYFQSVYTVSSAFVDFFGPDQASIFKDFDTSMGRVLGIVHKLDETKSRGPDNLPPHF